MFARKYLVKVFANVLSSLLSFLSLMVMTRYVGTEYGVMMWGFSFVAIFNAVADLGFGSAHIRSISVGNDHDRSITTYIVIKIVLAVVAVAGVLISLLIQGLGGAGYSEEMISIVITFVIYFVIFNLTSIMTITYIARMEAGKDFVVVVTESVVRSILLIFLAMMGVSAAVLSVSYLAGAIVSLIVCIFVFRSVKYRLKRPLMMREYITFTAPLALAVLSIAIISNLDRVLIGIYYGDQHVGFYSAAMGIIFAMTSMGTVVGGVLLSHFSKLNYESRTEDMRNTLWTVQKYTSVLILPPTLFLIIFGTETAIILFGIGYSAAGETLSILAISAYLAIMLSVIIQLLHSFNKTYVYGKIAIVYSLITLSLLILTVPDNFLGFKVLGMGTVGAALSVVIGNIFFLLIIGVVTFRITGISTYPKLYLHLVAFAASVAVAYLIKHTVGVEGVLSALFAFLLIAGMYFFVLVLTKEFGKRDIAFIFEVMDIRKTHRDTIEERKK